MQKYAEKYFFLLTGSYHYGLFLFCLLSHCLFLSNGLRISIGVVIISINLFSIGLNYFYNFLQDGGIPKDKIHIGGFYDSGLNFIDMKPLVKKLNEYKSNKPIYIEDVNTHRMLFLINKSYLFVLG